MFCKIRRIGKRFENGRFPREARITGGSLSRNTKHDEDSLITQTQPRAETQYSNYAHVAVESRTQTAQTGRASWPKATQLQSTRNLSASRCLSDITLPA
jgi:hypothetical protein